MAMLRYQISLSVLKYFKYAKRFHISKQPCNVSFITINTNEIPKPTIISLAKGAICHVDIAMVIFSHVKITRYFNVWRYQVFA